MTYYWNWTFFFSDVFCTQRFVTMKLTIEINIEVLTNYNNKEKKRIEEFIVLLESLQPFVLVHEIHETISIWGSIVLKLFP